MKLYRSYEGEGHNLYNWNSIGHSKSEGHNLYQLKLKTYEGDNLCKLELYRSYKGKGQNLYKLKL